MCQVYFWSNTGRPNKVNDFQPVGRNCCSGQKGAGAFFSSKTCPFVLVLCKVPLRLSSLQHCSRQQEKRNPCCRRRFVELLKEARNANGWFVLNVAAGLLPSVLCFYKKEACLPGVSCWSAAVTASSSSSRWKITSVIQWDGWQLCKVAHAYTCQVKLQVRLFPKKNINK